MNKDDVGKARRANRTRTIFRDKIDDDDDNNNNISEATNGLEKQAYRGNSMPNIAQLHQPRTNKHTDTQTHEHTQNTHTPRTQQFA